MIRAFNECSEAILQIAIMSFKPHTTCNIETYIRKRSMCVWLKLITADKIFIEIGLIIMIIKEVYIIELYRIGQVLCQMVFRH